MDTSTRAEYRELTPEEIACAVIIFRKARDLKQITLAARAEVTERTIQRIEQGRKVDTETLRRVALGLGLPEHAFIGAREIAPPEEAMARAERASAFYTPVDLHPFSSWRDVEAYATMIHGQTVFDPDVDPDTAELTAALRDYLRDVSDIWDEANSASLIEYCKTAYEMIEAIQKRGYVCRYGRYETKDRFNAAILTVLPRHDERTKLKQALMPALFMDMARGKWAPD